MNEKKTTFVGVKKDKEDHEPIFPGINFHSVDKNPNYIDNKNKKRHQTLKNLIPFPHSGHGTSRGRRKTMEDRHITLDNFKVGNLTISYYGVYDGKKKFIEFIKKFI